MTTYNYSSYTREDAETASADPKRNVIEQYVFIDDYESCGGEPFLTTDDRDNSPVINEFGNEADRMFADVIFGELETRNGEDYSEYLERVYFPECEGFGVEQDTDIYDIITVDADGYVVAHHYTFDGFLPACDLYDDAEEALHESRTWVEQIADEEGLRVQPTTACSTGYPKNEQLAVVGFEDFEQAEKFADHYDLKLVHLELRDGQTFAYRCGGVPFCAYDLEEIEPEGYEDGDERYAMEYHDDVTTYIIGALID